MKRMVISCVSSVLLCAWWVGPALAAEGFSADMVSRHGRETMQAKIYSMPDRTRVEAAGNIIITRMDKQLMWMAMPAERIYMEQPLDLQQVPKTARTFDGEIERTPLGTEIIDGKPADKFQVTYMEGGRRTSVYQWLRGGQWPVKVAAVDGSWDVEYRHLVVGPQPATLFEPPDGYQPMTMPGMAGGAPNLQDLISQMGQEQ